MPNKSIYDVYFGAGKSGGEYEASLQGVGDVWSDIESSRAMTATKGERRERTLDTILAATELTSQVAGGFEARKEFKSSLEQVGANIDKGAAVKVGKGGQAWSELNPLEKLFQRPEYKFGDNIQMSRADITTAGQMLQLGGAHSPHVFILSSLTFFRQSCVYLSMFQINPVTQNIVFD